MILCANTIVPWLFQKLQVLFEILIETPTMGSRLSRSRRNWQREMVEDFSSIRVSPLESLRSKY